MNQQHSPMRRFAIAVLTTVLAALGLSGQELRRSRTPMTWDWSNRHLIFSKPRRAEQASRIGKDPQYSFIRRGIRARFGRYQQPIRDGECH